MRAPSRAAERRCRWAAASPASRPLPLILYQKAKASFGGGGCSPSENVCGAEGRDADPPRCTQRSEETSERCHSRVSVGLKLFFFHTHSVLPSGTLLLHFGLHFISAASLIKYI